MEYKVSIDDIWPQERDVISRPERYKYVRKLIAPEGCVFCRSRDGGVSLDSLCMHQSHHSMVVANKYPYNSGHILVLPKRHCGDLTDLTAEEYLDLSQCFLTALKVVKSVYHSSEAMNLGMNHGRAAGAGIPEHLHWHIIPRWLGDTNFFPLIAETKVLPETLDQTYQKLAQAFKEL